MKSNEFIEKLIQHGQREWDSVMSSYPLIPPKSDSLVVNPLLLKARSFFDSSLHDAIVLEFNNPNGLNLPEFTDAVFIFNADRCLPIQLTFQLRFENDEMPEDVVAVFRSPMIIKDEDGSFTWTHKADTFWEHPRYGNTRVSVLEEYGTRVIETRRLDLALAHASWNFVQLHKLRNERAAAKGEEDGKD